MIDAATRRPTTAVDRPPSGCNVPSSSAVCDHLNCGCSDDVFITRSTALPLPLHMKYIDVQLLTMQHLYVAVDVKCRLRDIFHCVCSHAGVVDARLFGLSLFVQNEYRFLDPSSKLSKCTPKNWSKSGGSGTDMTGQPSVILYLRVHTFVDTVRLITCPMSLLHYYMQLRENVRVQWKENAVREERCFEVVALALQADYGDHSPSLEPVYFRPDSYFPHWVIARRGFDFLCRHTPAMHKEHRRLQPQEARYRFCELVSCQPSAVNLHVYSLKKSKHAPAEAVRLGIGPTGVEVSEVVSDQCPRLVSFLLWSNIRKLSFDRQKFNVHSVDGDRMAFYAVDDQKARYLFQFCRAVHQNLIHLRADILAVKSRTAAVQTTFRESYISSDLSDAPSTTKITDSDSSCKASDDSVKVPSGQSNGTQRISLVSDASSNTTSGIVSDKQVPHDDSENENDACLDVDIGRVVPSSGADSTTTVHDHPPVAVVSEDGSKVKQPLTLPVASSARNNHHSSSITIRIDGMGMPSATAASSATAAASTQVSLTFVSSGDSATTMTTASKASVATLQQLPSGTSSHSAVADRNRLAAVAFSGGELKHSCVDIPEIRRKTLNTVVVNHNFHTLDKIIYPIVTFAPTTSFSSSLPSPSSSSAGSTPSSSKAPDISDSVFTSDLNPIPTSTHSTMTTVTAGVPVSAVLNHASVPKAAGWFKLVETSSYSSQSSPIFTPLKKSSCEQIPAAAVANDKSSNSSSSLFLDNFRELRYGRQERDLGRLLPVSAATVNGCYQRKVAALQPMVLDGTAMFLDRYSPVDHQWCQSGHSPPRLAQPTVASLLTVSGKQHSNSLLNIPAAGGDSKLSGLSPPNYEQALRQKAERQGKRWTTVTGIDPSFLSQANVLLNGQLVQTHSEPGLGVVGYSGGGPSPTVGTPPEAVCASSSRLVKLREDTTGNKHHVLWRKNDFNNKSISSNGIGNGTGVDGHHPTLAGTNHLSAPANGMLPYDVLNRGNTVSRAHSMQEQTTSASGQRLAKDFVSQERRPRRYCTTCCEDHTMVEKIDLAKLKSMIRSNGIDLPLIRALCNDHSLQPSSSTSASTPAIVTGEAATNGYRPVGCGSASHGDSPSVATAGTQAETRVGSGSSSTSASPDIASLFSASGRPLSLQEGALYHCATAVGGSGGDGGSGGGSFGIPAAAMDTLDLFPFGRLDRAGGTLYSGRTVTDLVDCSPRTEHGFGLGHTGSGHGAGAVNYPSQCCFVSAPNLLDQFVVPPPPYPCHLPLKNGAQCFSISAACEATR